LIIIIIIIIIIISHEFQRETIVLTKTADKP